MAVPMYVSAMPLVSQTVTVLQTSNFRVMERHAQVFDIIRIVPWLVIKAQIKVYVAEVSIMFLQLGTLILCITKNKKIIQQKKGKTVIHQEARKDKFNIRVVIVTITEQPEQHGTNNCIKFFQPFRVHGKIFYSLNI